MKILFLGPYNEELLNFLRSFGDEFSNTEQKVILKDLEQFDFIISYRYRHIIGKEIIENFKNRIINLHISYLPWNRGSDCNLWSFLDDSPKGVTIHYIDCGIDTGDIIAQRKVAFRGNETLRTSYDNLSKTITALFKELWPDIRKGKIKSHCQPAGGSYHRSKDKEKFIFLLTKGWDTPISELTGRIEIHKTCDAKE